jgi:hypothetical protein
MFSRSILKNHYLFLVGNLMWGFGFCWILTWICMFLIKDTSELLQRNSISIETILKMCSFISPIMPFRKTVPIIIYMKMLIKFHMNTCRKYCAKIITNLKIILGLIFFLSVIKLSSWFLSLSSNIST